MRNNAKRKLSIITVGCLATVCASVGGISLASAETVDPALLMENDGAFYMIEGASLKLYQGNLDGIDGNAMRFIFEMSETQYENIIENGEYKDGVSVESYVIAEDMIDKGLTTAQEIAGDSNVITTKIPADKWLKATSKVKGSAQTVYYACAYVYNLPKEYYDDNVASFAIATTLEGALYTSVQSRSMSYIANAALESGEYEADRATLEGYLTDKFVWLKNVNDPIVVTDFTTGPYIKQTETQSAFKRAHSTWHYNNGAGSEIITNSEVGGVAGTYAKVEFSANQTSNQKVSRNFSLMNTMSIETLQAYADMGYTLKLPVYLATNGTNAGETSTVYTLEYDRSGETPTLKTITESSRTTTIQTDAWQEVELNIDDYILTMQTLADNAKESGNRYYYQQVTNDSAILNIQIRYGTSEKPAWTAYFGTMYLEAPTEALIATKGMTVDFASYVPETEGGYEYYKVENGVYTELKKTSIVAGKNDFKIAIVKVADGVRMVANFVEVRVETADEWLADLNESISGTKVVTDYTKEGSAYTKLMSGKTYTYFANSTYGYTSTTTGDKAVKIVAGNDVGEENANYAKLGADSGKYRPIWLQPTMTTAEMQKYYELGYSLKVKVYISSAATVRGLHYDRTDSLNPTKSSGMDTTYADTKDEYSIIKNTLTEITIDFADYIYDCQANNTDDGPISAQIKYNDTKLRGTLWFKCSYGSTIYISEMYLEAPKGDTTVEVEENGSLTVADYKPTDEGTYEYYKFESGVYTAIEETTVSVGANDFQIAIVKVAIVDGKVERTFVKRVDVTVGGTA